MSNGNKYRDIEIRKRYEKEINEIEQKLEKNHYKLDDPDRMILNNRLTALNTLISLNELGSMYNKLLKISSHNFNGIIGAVLEIQKEINKGKDVSDETKRILNEHAEELKKKQKKLSIFENASFSIFSSNITGLDAGSSPPPIS